MYWPPGWLIVQVASRSHSGYWKLQDVRPLVKQALEKQQLWKSRNTVYRELLAEVEFTQAGANDLWQQ